MEKKNLKNSKTSQIVEFNLKDIPIKSKLVWKPIQCILIEHKGKLVAKKGLLKWNSKTKKYYDEDDVTSISETNNVSSTLKTTRELLEEYEKMYHTDDPK